MELLVVQAGEGQSADTISCKAATKGREMFTHWVCSVRPAAAQPSSVSQHSQHY